MAYLQHTAPTEGNKQNLSLVRGMSLTLASMGMTINRAMVSAVGNRGRGRGRAIA